MGIKDFVIMEKLGSGSFATVFKARRLIDQKIYALKQINMKALQKRQKNNALNQIRLLACLDSKHIIRYCESFYEEKSDFLYIALEYADKGDLYRQIQSKRKVLQGNPQSQSLKHAMFDEIEVWRILLHLLYGLAELHQRQILHRDLKPENIFICSSNQTQFKSPCQKQNLESRVYKIGDMNVSKLLYSSSCQSAEKQKLAHTQTGTPYYASPQVWNDQPYDQKSDIWSLGCILYEVMYLKPPFVAEDMDLLYQKVTKEKPSCPRNGGKATSKGRMHSVNKYSKQLDGIMEWCLQKNAENRPSAKELLENFTVKMYANILMDDCYAPSGLDDTNIVSGSTKEPKKSCQSAEKTLLNTIYMPKRKKDLQQKLPLSNYKEEHSFKQKEAPSLSAKNSTSNLKSHSSRKQKQRIESRTKQGQPQKQNPIKKESPSKKKSIRAKSHAQLNKFDYKAELSKALKKIQTSNGKKKQDFVQKAALFPKFADQPRVLQPIKLKFDVESQTSLQKNSQKRSSEIIQQNIPHNHKQKSQISMEAPSTEQKVTQSLSSRLQRKVSVQNIAFCQVILNFIQKIQYRSYFSAFYSLKYHSNKKSPTKEQDAKKVSNQQSQQSNLPQRSKKERNRIYSLPKTEKTIEKAKESEENVDFQKQKISSVKKVPKSQAQNRISKTDTKSKRKLNVENTEMNKIFEQLKERVENRQKFDHQRSVKKDLKLQQNLKKKYDAKNCKNRKADNKENLECEPLLSVVSNSHRKMESYHSQSGARHNINAVKNFSEEISRKELQNKVQKAAKRFYML